MKNLISKPAAIKCVGLFCLLITFVNPARSQMDTLHLYYNQVQTTLHDTCVAKIDKWVKKLNGQHVDIKVVAYFSRPEFKKYSQQRADELFLILNRKARSLITIESIGPKKGENSQRSTVDVIYKPTITPEMAAANAANAAKEKEEAAKKKEAEKGSKDKKESAEKGDKKADGGDEKTAKSGDKGKDKKSGKEKTETKEEGGEQTSDDEKSKKGKRGDTWDLGFYGQSTQVSFNDGYSLTLEELKYIKSAKVVVGQSGIKDVDDDLYKTVKEFWDFNTNISQMPYEEAIKMGKANKKDTMVIISFMRVKTFFEEKYGPVKVQVPFIGFAVGIENAKGKTLIKQFVTKAKEQHPTVENLTFGVSVLNDLCNTMYENKLAKSGKMDEYYDLRTPELKTKTMIIPEFMIHPKLPREEIPQFYSWKYKVVPDNEWKETILEKKDVAYPMVVMIPRPPKGYYYYVVDAKTGKVIFIDYGPKMSVSPGAGVNLAPSQSGYVDKSNFEKYEKGIANAEKDNEKRADSKAKDEEKTKEKALKKEKEAEEKKAKEKEKEEKKNSEKKKESTESSDNDKKKESTESSDSDKKKESKESSDTDKKKEEKALKKEKEEAEKKAKEKEKEEKAEAKKSKKKKDDKEESKESKSE